MTWVRSLSDPQWQMIKLFTNRAGKFALKGFKVGRNELKLVFFCLYVKVSFREL